MKKILLASVAAAALFSAPAFAADMPYKAAPIAPWSWTGFYIGGNLGGGWGDTSFNDPSNFFGPVNSFRKGSTNSLAGLLGGGQVGYNYQVGSIVYGLEADFDWANLDGNSNCSGDLNGASVSWICHTRANAVGTVAARLGYAFGHSLVYLKGGAGWAHDKYDVSSFFVANRLALNDTRWGGMIGAGFEQAITPRWSIKAEYNYIGFGTEHATLNGLVGPSAPADIKQNISLFKMGVNYRFGDGPDVWSSPSAMPVKAPMRVASDWMVDMGTRYWYSEGKFRKDLFDPVVAGQMNSRLTWTGMNGNSLEGFARAEHRSGLFVKGYLGLGTFNGGRVNDEDFPPAVVPYSNTVSPQKNGRLVYGAGDLGFDFWTNPAAKLGAFVGYAYYNPRENGFGCTQIATNPAICSPGQVPPGQLGLSETETWQGVRLGLNGEVMVNRFKLNVDAAYLPHVNFSSFDNHWLRPDIDPLKETGHGDGYQLEAILSYLVTDQFSIGVGGRYWWLNAPHASTTFPGNPPSPMTFRDQRYGVFLQADYKFGLGQ